MVTDRLGVRAMLTLSVGLMGLFFVLLALTHSFFLSLLVLFLYGLSNGVMIHTASRSVLDWFPAVGRATAMGVKQTGVNFGGILAGVLIPVLAIHFSWRRSLLLVGTVELALAGVIYKMARESPYRSPNSRSSLAWKKIFQVAFQPNMLILGGMGFCFMASQFCFSAYLTLFLTKEIHLPVVQSGQYFALSYLAGAGARLFWSLMSDYFLKGRRRGVLLAVTVIMLLASIALGLVSFFPPLSVITFLIVLAFGISGLGWNALYLTMLGESMGEETIGLATGAGYFWGFMGSLLSPPFFGYLVDASGSYAYSWLFLAGCSGVAIFLLSIYEEPKKT
jgi:ACS family hexuronate transporter-like MFS transporter